MFEWLIPLLVFISVLLLAVQIQKKIKELTLARQAMVIASAGELKSGPSKQRKLFDYGAKLIQPLGAWQQPFISTKWAAKISNKLMFHHDWQFRSAAQWLALKECAAAVGLLGGWWLTHDWFWTVLMTICSFYLPDLWLKERRQYYQRSIMQALPNSLDLLAAGIQAGLNFEQALTVMIDRNHEGIIYLEFKEMMRTIQVGQSRQEAFKVMAARVADPDFSAFISALIQSEKMGAPLAETLKSQASQLRIKYGQKIEKQALEAPVKMLFPLILFIFPIIFIILFGPIILRFLQGF